MESQHKREGWALIFSWRWIIVVLLAALFLLVNLPTKYASFGGATTGLATSVFQYSSRNVPSGDLTCFSAGFPKRFVYTLYEPNSTLAVARFFSVAILLIDFGICLFVIGCLVFRLMRRNQYGKVQVRMSDLMFLTLLVGLCVAWANERKVLKPLASISTARDPSYTMTKNRVWQLQNSFSFWLLPESSMGNFYTVSDVEIHEAKLENLAARFNHPLIERIAILGSRTRIENVGQVVEKIVSESSGPNERLSVRELTKLPRSWPTLRTLELDYCRIDDEALNWIKSQRNLSSLNLVNCEIAAIPKDFFASLPNLTQIDFRDSEFQQQGIDDVGACPELRLLAIDVKHYSQAMANSFSGNKNICEIMLTGEADLVDVNLHDMPSLQFLSIPAGRRTSLSLKNLPELSAVEWSARLLSDFDRSHSRNQLTFRTGMGVMGGMAGGAESFSISRQTSSVSSKFGGVILNQSQVVRCPKIRLNWELVFGSDCRHEIDNFNAETNLTLSVPKNSDISTQANLRSFFTNVSPSVTGGKLTVRGPIWPSALTAMPCGLKAIDVRGADPDHELSRKGVPEAFHSPILIPTSSLGQNFFDISVLNDKQLESLEEFSTSVVLSGEKIQRCIKVMPNLRRFSARSSALTDLFISHHQNIESFIIEPGGTPLPSGPIGQAWVMNCPNLNECRIWSDDISFFCFYNLPRLQSIILLNSSIQEVQGLPSLTHFTVDAKRFCGNLKESLAASSQLSQINLSGNFSSTDLKQFFDDHCATLQWVALDTADINTELIELIKAHPPITWTLDNCTFQVGDYVELLTLESGPAVKISRPTFIRPDMPIGETTTPEEKIRLYLLQLDGAKIDDTSARWLAQHARTNHLELMGADCKAELLLSVLLQDDKATLEWSDTRSLTLSTNLFSTEFIEALNAFPNRLVIYTDSNTTPEQEAKVSSRHIVKSIEEYKGSLLGN